MWTYLKVRKGKKRNSLWIWTAVIDKKKVLFEVGERGEETFLRLYEQLPEASSYYSDGYKVYHWLPSDIHHEGKFGPVNRNEAKHSALRRHLNRLARKTQGYSKSLLMLKGSIALACLYLGWL